MYMQIIDRCLNYLEMFNFKTSISSTSDMWVVTILDISRTKRCASVAASATGITYFLSKSCCAHNWFSSRLSVGRLNYVCIYCSLTAGTLRDEIFRPEWSLLLLTSSFCAYWIIVLFISRIIRFISRVLERLTSNETCVPFLLI